MRTVKNLEEVPPIQWEWSQPPLPTGKPPLKTSARAIFGTILRKFEKNHHAASLISAFLLGFIGKDMRTKPLLVVIALVAVIAVGAVYAYKPAYGLLTNTGTLNILMTDPPVGPGDSGDGHFEHSYLNVTSLNVTISQIALRQAGIDNITYTHIGDDWESHEHHSDNSSAGWIYLSIPPTTVDLIKMVGQNYTFGSLQIPVGNYSSVRLYITQASVSLRLGQINGTFTLNIPNNYTNIKVNFDRPLQITAGGGSSILIDFSVQEHDAEDGWFLPSITARVIN